MHSEEQTDENYGFCQHQRWPDSGKLETEEQEITISLPSGKVRANGKMVN